ncbi:MAG: MBL fold metallo-hydrolase RNA specificity domain-containing protein [Patescibacteria group bacterium]
MTLEGYSAHADQDQLLGWTSSARHQLKRVFLVQGEHEQAELLAQKIRDLLAVKTHIPELEEKVELE